MVKAVARHLLPLPLLLALLFSAELAAPAEAQRVGVAAHVGTLGLGADLAVSANRRLALRGRVSLFPYEPTFEEEGVEFTVRPSSPRYMVVADFYPVGQFRLTGGVLISPSDLEVVGQPVEPVDIGERTYGPQELGTVTGMLTTRTVAPYVGLGFGNPAAPGFGFFFEIGAAFHGTPELGATADGPVASDPQFRADLDAEVAERQEDVDPFTIYPVLALGFSIRLASPRSHAIR